MYDSIKKPVNISILNTVIETAVKSNANSGINRQSSSNYSFKDYTKAHVKSYRNKNSIIDTSVIANNHYKTKPNPPPFEQNEQFNFNKKQKFKFKMKLCRENTSLGEYVPCFCLWLMLILVTAVYFGIVWPRLVELFNSTFYWLFLLFVKVYFLVNLIVNFLISMFRDPGRLPMAKSNNNNNVIPSKNEIIVFIKGESVELKWCTVNTYLFLKYQN